MRPASSRPSSGARRGARRRLHQQHDLAELAAGLESRVGLLGLVQRVGRRDRNVDGPGFEQRQHRALHRPGGRSPSPRAAAGGSSRRGSARAWPSARRGGHRALAPAPIPITMIRPQRLSALTSSWRLGAPTSSRITSNGPCSAKPSGAITSAPSAATWLAQIRVADGRGHAGARRAAELDRGGADAAGAAVDEQPLAELEPAWVKTRVVGGGEHLRGPARLWPVEAVGNRHQLTLVDDRELGLAAAADDRHHAVALAEAQRARARARRPRRRARGPGCPAASPAAPGSGRAAGACRRRSDPPRGRGRAPRRRRGPGRDAPRRTAPCRES